MKVVFLFTSEGSAQPHEVDPNWRADKPCSESYSRFNEEGYFYLLQELVKSGVISDLKVFFESNKGPGKANWIPEAQCEVIPHISLIDKYIDPDTIIFVRGGFKHWCDWLLKYKFSNWLILYAANTGREKWRFWDIVLNDLNPDTFIDETNRLQYHFIKPIHPEVFQSNYLMKPTFDVCIGASHIHDKKGQWRTFKVLQAYEKLYGKRLKAVMPGSVRGSTKTNQMLEDMKDWVEIFKPGMISRKKLSDIFNSCKLFLHLGTGGQNDRGPLEALSCGLKTFIGSPSYHASELFQYNELAWIPPELDDYESIAGKVNEWLFYYSEIDKKTIDTKFKQTIGFNKSYRSFVSLLSYLKNNNPSEEIKQKIVEEKEYNVFI